MIRGRSIWVWLTLLLFCPASAGAIDVGLCADDGVTEIPPFAHSRDANGCLMIDPGNGDALVPFQYEIFHKKGLSISAKDSGETLPPGVEWIDTRMDDYGNCRTASDGEYCTELVWNTTFDNYLAHAGKNDDILHHATKPALEYWYFKNTRLMNGWVCKGGTDAWSRVPGEISCEAGENSGSHSDGIQLRSTMVNDGWIIFQDSALVNAHQQILLWQTKSTEFPTGTNVLLQGFQLGTLNEPMGESVHWMDDCEARGSHNPCVNNIASGGHPVNEEWLIDVYGNVTFGAGTDQKKIVVVNTGCDKDGCNGTVGYKNGWPHPLGRNSISGPGSCPNGYIGNTCGNTDACFCYTSLENALNDTATSTSNFGDCPADHCPHKAPPFAHLSEAGWENPPDAAYIPAPTVEEPPATEDPPASAETPPAPVLLSVTSAVVSTTSTEEPPAPTSQAAIEGFALWDAQADNRIDGSFESGDEIVVSDHDCTAIEVLGNDYLSGSSPGSVSYAFDGEDLGACSGTPGRAFENSAPYAWEADAGPGKFSCAPSLTELGNHSLTVTPYDGNDCGGIRGASVTINFVVR